MPVNASINRFPIDEELILRAASAGAQTNDGGSTDYFVLGRDDSYWGFDIITDHEIAVVLDCDTLEFGDANETYSFSVQVDSDVAFGTPSTVITKVVTAVGRYTFVIPREAIVAADATAAYLRVHLDVGGTTPSMVWSAYVSPVLGG